MSYRDQRLSSHNLIMNAPNSSIKTAQERKLINLYRQLQDAINVLRIELESNKIAGFIKFFKEKRLNRYLKKHDSIADSTILIDFYKREEKRIWEADSLKYKKERELELRRLRGDDIKLKQKEKELLNAYPHIKIDMEMKNNLFEKLILSSINPIQLYEYIHKKDYFILKKFNLSSSPNYTDEYFYNIIWDYEKNNQPKPPKIWTEEELAEKSKQCSDLPAHYIVEIYKMEEEKNQAQWDEKCAKFNIWAKDAKACYLEFPTFDLIADYPNKTFQEILNVSNIKTAYELLHFYELYEKKENSSFVELQGKIEELSSTLVSSIMTLAETAKNSFLYDTKISTFDTLIFSSFLIRALCIGCCEDIKKAQFFDEEFINQLQLKCDCYEKSSIFKSMLYSRFSFYDRIFAKKNTIQMKISAIVEEFEYIIKFDFINKEFKDFQENSPLPILGIEKDAKCTIEVRGFFNQLPLLLQPYLNEVQEIMMQPV